MAMFPGSGSWRPPRSRDHLDVRSCPVVAEFVQPRAAACGTLRHLSCPPGVGLEPHDLFTTLIRMRDRFPRHRLNRLNTKARLIRRLRPTGMDFGSPIRTMKRQSGVCERRGHTYVLRRRMREMTDGDGANIG